MDRQKERIHLNILKSRVNSLEKELEAAIKASKVIDDRISTLQDGLKTINTNRQDRIQEIKTRYEGEIADQERLILLARDVLAKKTDERRVLMTYLTSLDLGDGLLEDFRDFDWANLQRLVEHLNKPKIDLVRQNQKAELLNELILDTKEVLTSLNEVLSSTSQTKDRYTKSIDAFKEQFSRWLAIRSNQENKIVKLQRDNERLNVLLRQCVSANEHMTDYITKNVQAKCHSFLTSDSPHELLEGLKKFKERQDRVIKLLKHKDDQLGSETNNLEVAKDQTHDQLKFYSNLIVNQRPSHMSRILGQQSTATMLNSASGA